jgi:predicted permease
MIRNYLKLPLRNLWKNKGYSFLNIFGLATGIACAALIFLWVEDEMHFDANNLNRDQLYQVMMNAEVDAGIMTHSSTPAIMGPTMQSEIPGIENMARTTEEPAASLITAGDKSVYARGLYADSALLSMFTLPFVEGNPHDAFTPLYSMVITQTAAKKIFGRTSGVIGKSVRADNKQDYVITGVIKDLPENATLQFEWLAPFRIWIQDKPWAHEWKNFNTSTYVQLRPGVSPASVNKSLYNYIQEKQGASRSTVHPFLYSMRDWHLRNDFENGKMTGRGTIQYVRLFSIIAWIILFIACINFMNLATARSEKRAREVGVKKVLGARKKNLVAGFIAESVCTAGISALIGVLLVYMALPAFNTLVQKNLTPDPGNPAHILILAGLTLLCGLVAGSYPSLYLSSFNPVFVLKRIKTNAGSASLIRKGLVVLQFAVSVVLIISTLIIFQQIRHIKSRNLGYNKDHLVQLRVQGNMEKNFTAIRQDLLSTGAVENAALADHETISAGNNTTAVYWPGKEPGSIVVISQRLVSPEFLSTTGMHLIEGRDFEHTDIVRFNDDHLPVDSTQVMRVIITRSLEKILGNGSALGKTLQRQSNDRTFTMQVVGVVKDYVYGNMYSPSPPVIFYCIPQAATLLYVRAKATGDPESTLAQMETVMKKDNPGYPFEYQFVDDQFNARFLSEMLISKLSRVFALLAILISCLGLFGLAAYTAERRKKEIGVRKVMGASVAGIARLISIDFLKLVALACLIAFPVSGWIMHNWLDKFPYRIHLSAWVFLIAGGLSMLIALVTVSFQAIKAAVANPVKSLRTE